MSSDSMRIFGKNLTYYLNRSGKTQKELAAIIGVPATTFNDWCRGRRMPKMDKVEMLSNFFGCRKSDLIEEQTDTVGADLSPAKRQLLDLAKGCSEEDAERLLQMMQLFLNKR